MKFLQWFSALLVSMSPTVAPAQAPVHSVPAVDLARYAGQWFEIASYPMFFQRQCVGDTTADYASAADGTVTVVNRCRTGSGFDQATGKATVVAGTGNSQLRVSFFWPFKADYWVIGLDPDYRWAVVAGPDRKFLWILSRAPQLARGDMAAALAAATSQGFDLGRLRYTSQAAAGTTSP